MLDLKQKTYDTGINVGDLRLIPGVVIDNNDPKVLGRVKAYAPGLFDTKTMDKEALPWVYPFCMSGLQRYSTQNTSTKIWILFIPDNPYGYFYIPFFEQFSITKDNISGETDIIISRVGTGGNVSVHYNSRDGFVSQVNDSKINITSGGDIINSSNGSEIKIEGGHVYFGSSGGGYEPGVLGNKLQDLFTNMITKINNLSQLAQQSPYTQALVPGFNELSNQISSDKENILSEIVSLN